MTYPSDDLTPLFNKQTTSTVGLRSGVVVAWDPLTAENIIEVDGALIENIGIFNTNEALLLKPGDVVKILTSGAGASSWGILGRFTLPGTPEAASALSMIRTYADAIPSLEFTSSTSFTDLATVGPQVDVTVGPSGRLLIMATCLFDYNGNDTQGGGYMAYDITGATSKAANEFDAVKSVFNASDATADTVNWIAGARMTAVSLEEDLNPGAHTITAKYKVLANSCQFGMRLLVAIAL